MFQMQYTGFGAVFGQSPNPYIETRTLHKLLIPQKKKKQPPNLWVRLIFFAFPVKPISCTLFRVSMQGSGQSVRSEIFSFEALPTNPNAVQYCAVQCCNGQNFRSSTTAPRQQLLHCPNTVRPVHMRCPTTVHPWTCAAPPHPCGRSIPYFLYIYSRTVPASLQAIKKPCQKTRLFLSYKSRFYRTLAYLA